MQGQEQENKPERAWLGELAVVLLHVQEGGLDPSLELCPEAREEEKEE